MSADERGLSARGRKGHALRPHAQRQWARGRPDAGGGDRELPERGRVGDDPRSVQAVYPRSRPDRAGALMRILLTNDDGYHAPGLKVLEEIAARFSDDVWVVAPTEEQSGAGHSLTLTRPDRKSVV